MTPLEHIQQTARDLGVVIRYNRAHGETSSADPVNRVLYLEPYTNDPVEQPLWYYVALHELGHVHDQPQYTTDFIDSMAKRLGIITMNWLEGEARAWEYALDNAILPLTEDVRADIALALGSYLMNGEGSPSGLTEDLVPALTRVTRRVGNTAITRAAKLHYNARDAQLKQGAAAWDAAVLALAA